MSTPQTRRWSGDRRRVPAQDRTWVRTLVVAGIAVLDVVLWAVIIWGVVAVVNVITSVAVLLLSLADKVVAAR